MIAFAIAWTPFGEGSSYKKQADTYAIPGIERVAKTGVEVVVIAVDAEKGLANAYNEAAALARSESSLEMMVTIHPDLEILDGGIAANIREAFKDPEVAIAGAIGARNIRGIAWWEGHGVGRVWHGAESPQQPGVRFREASGDVEAVDGCIVAFSPWALGNLRFDADRYTGFHGWEVDICTQAKAAGKRVVVVPTDVRHHSKGGFGDRKDWERCDLAFRAKWGKFMEREKR